MQITIKEGIKKINIKNVKKVSELGKISGLMFRSREECPPMLFEFKKPTRMRIHSFFVFFKFAAVWLDDKNRVIDKKIVKPFRLSISSKKPFYKLLEIPLNKKYKKDLSYTQKNVTTFKRSFAVGERFKKNIS